MAATTSLTVHNFTHDELTIQLPTTSAEAIPEVATVPSNSVIEVAVPKRPAFIKWKWHVTLSKRAEENGHMVVLNRKCRKGFADIVKDEELPWTVYWIKESKTLQRLFVLPKRDLSTFLCELGDDLSLASLCLPGTHDAMARYGWPFSQCQTSVLAEQLNSGIRVIDVRLAIVNGRLISFHGVSNQRTPFQEVLSTVHTFLNDPKTCRETIVMSIKQEDFNSTPPPTFSAAVHSEIIESAGGMGMWFLENRIPNLGEVRGRVVMLSRFGGNGAGWDHGLEGMGIHPTKWPDSLKEGFSYQLKDTLVRMHDWYSIPTFLSIPEKVQLSTAVLVPSEDTPPVKTLNFTFLSAASVPFALPPTVARGFGWPQAYFGIEGVNSRVVRWMLQQLMGGEKATSPEEGQQQTTVEEKMRKKEEVGAVAVDPVVLRGWAMTDFFESPAASPVVPLFVEFNFLRRT